MSTKKHSFERRTDKLRASCDACYLAKVKCSKTRPLCQRCLVSGTNCAYSPSARFKRGPKTSGEGRVDRETVGLCIQEHSEANVKPDPSLMQLEQPSYQCHGHLNPDGQYSTLDPTLYPRNWTSDLLMSHEPMLLFNGEAATGLYPDIDGFDLPNQHTWWNNAGTMASNTVGADPDGNYMQLTSPEAVSNFSYPSWNQGVRGGLIHLPSSRLEMMDAHSSGAGTQCELDYGSFNMNANLSNLQHSRLKKEF